MDVLIWGGAAISAAGLAGLVYCIVTVWRARRAALPDEQMRDLVQRMIPINMGAMLLSVLGLIVVVVGITLG